MTKYAQLCQAYAKALKRTRKSRQKCLEFAETFFKAMSRYFEIEIEQHSIIFIRNNTIKVKTSLTLYECPERASDGCSESLIIYYSIENILDNYVVKILPWGKKYELFENELDRFEEVFKFVFEKIQEEYLNEMLLSERGKRSTRTFLEPF